MSSYNTYSNDLTITTEGGLGNLTVDGNLHITGNITSTGVSNLDVSNAYITVAANNTGTIQTMGLLAQQGNGNFAGLRFNTAIHMWEMSPQTFANGAPVAPYTPLNSTAAYSAGPGMRLSASQFSVATDGITTAIVAGNVAVAANATFQTPNIGNARGSSLSLTGNITAGNVTAVTAVRSNTVSASGNITTAGFFVGDGGRLSNINVSYSNVNVVALLSSGAITSNIITTANISGAYLLGNGSQLTGMYSNADVAAYLPLNTVDVTGGNIAAAAKISGASITATGNIQSDYFIGNGSQLTGLYGNVDVAAYLPTYTGDLTPGNVTAAGNVSGAFILGDGGFLSNIHTSYGNANVAAYLPTYTGDLTSGNLTVTGNVAAANLLGDGSLITGIDYSNIANTYGNANVAAFLPTNTADLGAGNVTALGNISGSFILGNVALATGLPTGYSNTLVRDFLSSGTDTANIITTANISGAYLLGNVSGATGLPTEYSNTLVSAYLQSGLNTDGLVTTGNVSGDFLIGNVALATGLPIGYSNTLVSNFLASGTDTANIVTTANISGAYLLGNIAQATGMYGNAEVAAYLPGYSGNISSNNATVAGTLTVGTTLYTPQLAVTGNISGFNILATGNVEGDYISGTVEVSSTGNVVGANLVSSGTAVVGNVRSDNYLFANGAPFIPAGSSYGNSNVAGFLPVYNGNLGATLFELGNASATVSTTSWSKATTNTTLNTVIFATPHANITGVDFNITVTNSTNRQVSKISSAVYGGTVVYDQYSSINTSGTPSASLYVEVSGANLIVRAEPAVSSLTSYTIVSTVYS